MQRTYLNHVMAIITATVIVAGGCSKSKDDKDTAKATAPQTESRTEQPQVTEQKGKVNIPTQTLPILEGGSDRIEMPNGEYIEVSTIQGVAFIPVEGTFDDQAFERVFQRAHAQSVTDAERIGHLQAALTQTVGKLKQNIKMTKVELYPELGYFTGLVALDDFQGLGDIENLPESLLINPVFTQPLDERSIRKMGADDVLANPRADSSSFSGLKRMGVTDFLKTVEAELGQLPTGSQVHVGVTDTGVTFGHPSFLGSDNKSRITYMKEFTGEGRIYFLPSAKFELNSAADGTLAVSAEVLRPTEGTRLPKAEDLQEINAPIKLSAEQIALLSTEGVVAKLGAMSEASYAGIDLNQNGKKDDATFALLIATADEYKIIYESSGTLDFRKAKTIGDFNKTGDTMEVVSEIFGFDIRSQKILDASGAEVDVIGAGIVGFDPGAHGTHVSGIIAGKKTITNDADTTLARGAAPEAKLMVNRVCANSSGCSSTQALIDLAQNGAEVINMSLGGLSNYNDGYSVEETIINRLTEQKNVLFVISAGNSGPGLNTVGSPSTARLALSVGATASRDMIERQYQWPGVGKQGPSAGRDEEDNDFMLFFSSRGPTAAGGFKPNISAPGTELSAVPFNTTNGDRRGLDVYWGTSMAAPAASGAIALLIDAAKIHNQKHPNNPLPVDALTIRKVLLSSAKPFDVSRFDPETGESSDGQYTWIDQGLGMINLPNAWTALKAERDNHLPSPVYSVDENGTRQDIALDYQVRVLRKNPNGINYDGSIEVGEQARAYTGALLGRGIWLDAKDNDTVVPVQIARRLPYSATQRADVGALKRLLATTKDDFVLKTVFYGSKVSWLKAGTLDTPDCSVDPTGQITVIGEGATDTDDGSNAARESAMNVCLDRAAIDLLPAGDHGALIMGYRQVDGTRSAHPDFIVPVYVTKSHQTLAGEAGYEVEGTVQSFGVDRHYVRIPEGTSVVSVKLEVDEASVSGTASEGCQAVRLYVLEASNTSEPDDIAGLKSIASNCDAGGIPTPDKRVVTYARANPKAGIWNLHVFGRYNARQSNYKLSVNYAKVRLAKKEIVGGPDALDGSLEMYIQKASLDAKPSEMYSSLKVDGFMETLEQTIANDEYMMAPNGNGDIARTYGPDVTSVTVTTGKSDGNDIDLYMMKCDKADIANATCAVIAQSTTATADETVTFTPEADAFYVAYIHGYEIVPATGSTYVLTETSRSKTSESATLTITESDERWYIIDYDFDQDASALLKSDLFTSGRYALVGSLDIKTLNNEPLVRIPVAISAP